jgi:hypothetical protein
MKIYVILWCGNEYSEGDVDAYLNREDWLKRLHHSWDEDSRVTGLSETDFLKFIMDHGDDQAGEFDLIGPDQKQPYDKVVVLIRNEGGLNPGPLDDVVAVYSTPAELPQPLLASDSIHHIQVEG